MLIPVTFLLGFSGWPFFQSTHLVRRV